MSLPKDVSEFNIIDDNFWDEFDDDSTSCEANGANNVADRGDAFLALQPPAKHKVIADVCKRTTEPEKTSDDNLFVATGLCAEDLQNCFDDDFDDCASETEPKKEEVNRRIRSDPAVNVLPEIPSDIFDDDSVGWLAEEPEIVPRKRKFPGPAGILPKSRPSLPFPGSGRTTGEVSSKKPEPHDDLLCTPWSAEAGDPLSPWQRLRQDLGIEEVKGSKLNQYSIAWVLKMKRLQQLPRGKVPVLCASIKNVAKDILTLRDGTGEILATIDKSCQDYKSCLKAGAAFILMKASVYVNDHSQHCLVLTKQNIALIYSCAEDGDTDITRVDVNPMTLQELEGICAQLEREALEDAAKRETGVTERQNSSLSSCGSPQLESCARNFSPVPRSCTNGRAQWIQGRENVTDVTIMNPFRHAGFLVPECSAQDNCEDCEEEVNLVATLGSKGLVVDIGSYASVDKDVPTCREDRLDALIEEVLEEPLEVTSDDKDVCSSPVPVANDVANAYISSLRNYFEQLEGTEVFLRSLGDMASCVATRRCTQQRQTFIMDWIKPSKST
ncbi:hypothetical protein HPB50_010166 [Hyalomma asiaticum]|uniref:Uncharacterized protein n=1 Tax=Hyalomma asiaticum TaxID=266040 RepID=A0ACB7SWY2_HYAAI|nr:hypothetical protein HPB50_010166 [Hyalomma asiaticum]